VKAAIGPASQRAPAVGKKRAGGRAKRTRPTAVADRELVLRVLRHLVACGVAEWTVLESGDIRLRLASGAVFNLGRNGVTRLA
jgi:hypothetical protein